MNSKMSYGQMQALKKTIQQRMAAAAGQAVQEKFKHQSYIQQPYMRQQAAGTQMPEPQAAPSQQPAAPQQMTGTPQAAQQMKTAQSPDAVKKQTALTAKQAASLLKQREQLKYGLIMAEIIGEPVSRRRRKMRSAVNKVQ